MTGPFNPDDLAAVREQGDLAVLFARLTGKPDPQPETPVEDEKPTYHITRPGAWPCGTAATGPSPGLSCPACQRKGPDQ